MDPEKKPRTQLAIQTITCIICFAYNQHPAVLKQCTSCKLVSYCGPEHQKYDWNYHKRFCRGISHIIKSFKLNHILEINGPIVGSSKKNFDTVKKTVELYLTVEWRRSLEKSEMMIVNFPKVCKVCYEYDHDRLSPCEGCRVVHYCSDEHRQQNEKNHREFCQFYWLHVAIIQNNLKKTAADLPSPNEILRPLKSLEIETFPENSSKLFELLTEKKLKNIPITSYDFDDLFAISNLTFVATTVYALSQLPHRYERNIAHDFRIDVVGAEMEEACFSANFIWLFFYYFRNVKNLFVNLIGPEIPVEHDPELEYFDGTHSAYLQTFRDRYENVTHRLAPAHLIIAFNCGFSEYENTSLNPWRLGIKSFFRQNDVINGSTCQTIPICFTSYIRKEVDDDFRVIERYAMEVNRKISFDIVLRGPNPFRDFRPIRNPFEEGDEDIYFINNYIHLLVPSYCNFN